jgi:thermostable 8-oxoguanine DNA glycosylase
MMTKTTRIDPYNITKFDRTEEELQLFLLFCIVVAGKTAYIQAEKLDQFIDSVNKRLMMPDHVSPFQTIKSAKDHGILLQEIKKAKLGQYKKINAAFEYIAEFKVNVIIALPLDLERIPGVGMKTSRFFCLHSDRRFENNIAILDTHILKFIRENIDKSAPKSTPTNYKSYLKWEYTFLEWCKQNDKDVASFDLEVWKTYARTKVKDLTSN